MTIVGVMQDFHYGKVENLIGPVAFTFWTPENRAIINAKIQEHRYAGALWRRSNPHGRRSTAFILLTAEFYSEEIEEAYSEFSTMIKIIGFLSFLAISIASMGLFGMVVFTTETRLKRSASAR